MSVPAWHRGSGRATRLGETALWTGAILAVFGAHVGAAAWLMREQPIVAADNAPPAAIMIEFAEEAEALNTEETDISEEMHDAEASAPAEEVPAPEEEPEEIVDERPEPEPVEDKVAEQQEEPVEEEIVELPNAEVPLPTARPKPPEPKREIVQRDKPRERSRQQQQQAAQQATRQAQAQVRQGSRNAARQTSSGVNAATAARWQSRLMAHLERRKRYPPNARRRGERGIVYIRFSIDERGNVGSVALARSSGYPALDNEVLSLVRRASPVPAPPPGANRTITAPVRFNVR